VIDVKKFKYCELGGHYVPLPDAGETVEVQIEGEKRRVWACRKCLVGTGLITEDLPPTDRDGMEWVIVD